MSRTTQECPRCGLTFRAKAKPKAKQTKGVTGYLCTLDAVFPNEACWLKSKGGKCGNIRPPCNYRKVAP